MVICSRGLGNLDVDIFRDWPTKFGHVTAKIWGYVCYYNIAWPVRTDTQANFFSGKMLI